MGVILSYNKEKDLGVIDILIDIYRVLLVIM